MSDPRWSAGRCGINHNLNTGNNARFLTRIGVPWTVCPIWGKVSQLEINQQYYIIILGENIRGGQSQEEEAFLLKKLEPHNTGLPGFYDAMCQLRQRFSVKWFCFQTTSFVISIWIDCVRASSSVLIIWIMEWRRRRDTSLSREAFKGSPDSIVDNTGSRTGPYRTHHRAPWPVQTNI